MGHVTQAKGDGDAVEIIVREGQCFGVGLDKTYVAGHAQIQQAVTANLEHGSVDVGQHDFAGRAHAFGEAARQVAGAAGDVQYPVAGAHAGQLDGEALPEAVDAAGHQVVHDVVLGGYRVEDLGDALSLFGLGNGLVTKVGGFFVLVLIAHDLALRWQIPLHSNHFLPPEALPKCRALHGACFGGDALRGLRHAGEL